MVAGTEGLAAGSGVTEASGVFVASTDGLGACKGSLGVLKAASLGPTGLFVSIADAISSTLRFFPMICVVSS